MINVTVIGFGNVGASLSVLLLNNKHPLRLNVQEPDQQAEGAFFDLTHAMTLYPNKELHVNDEDLFLSAEFIFFTAGTPSVHGGSRLSTAKQNTQLAQEIFEHRTFAKTPYIIVISNPVDIISQAVYQFSGLPADHVIGTGTFLDSIRLAYYLSTGSKSPLGDIEALVLGEHGSSQVPIYTMCKLKGQPLLEHSAFSAKDLDLAAQLNKDAAYRIRETQTATRYGISKCAEVLLDYLLGVEEHFLSLSVLTNEHYRSLLQLDHNIYIGLPVKLKKGSLKIYNEINFSEVELAALRKSAAVLANNME